MEQTMKSVLEQAKRTVQAGWCQGDYTDGYGNYCLKGAIGLAAGVLEDVGGRISYKSLALPDLRLDHVAYDLVIQHLPEPFESIPTYNDHPATTKNDVLAILDKAISSCEGVCRER